jgi:hypothetical protein
LAKGIPARLTAREGRKFGLTVGIAFLALAAIASWRGHPTARLVLAGIGLALALAGLLLPGRLGPVYGGWMKLALALSKVTTPIFMGVVYYLVLTPTALLRRAFGGNPMRAKEQAGGFWHNHPRRSGEPGAMARQF